MRKGYENDMRLLIDTNVILDLIFHRVGCEDSKCLFRKAEREDTERTYQIIENILKLTKVLSVTEQDIKDAFGENGKILKIVSNILLL
jgi:predicted nucleic acid-binding protein